MMEILEVAESFFRAHLPAKVTTALDWSTLCIADSARRTSEKQTTYTDITYVCYTKDEGLPIYLHVEQERNVDISMVERILQYNLGLYIQHRNQGHKHLPVIANFIIYNGNKRKKYPYHEQIYDYFNVPWMAQIFMGKFFALINLNEEDDLTLATHGVSGIMELLLKRASDSNFTVWLKEEGRCMKDIPSQRVIDQSVDYALMVGKEEPEEILEAFLVIYPEFKDTIMTAARQLEQRGEMRGEIRGEIRGIQEGMQTKAIEIAKTMVNKGSEITFIQEVTGLSKQIIEEMFNLYDKK